MGKNKSNRMSKTDWSKRRSAIQKVDNYLKKQSEHKPKGNGNGKKDKTEDA